MKYKKLLLLILIVAFVLRVVGISKFPTGFTQDEAGLGYDAYSLLKTGKDQWGSSWPLTLRSFGDFKLPVYTYLTIPSVAIFGLNEFAVRLPNAVGGTLAVLFTYLMVMQLTKRKKISLLSSFFLAISPWHVSLSRGAFEANLTTLFLPLGVWGFCKGLKKPRWMIISALAFGVNLFTYHSARLFTPIIILALFVTNWEAIKRTINSKGSYIFEFCKQFRWAILVFGIFLTVATVTMFKGAGTRGADVLILNPTDSWASVSDRRYEAVVRGMPDQIARVFSNKATYVVNRFVHSYLSYLSPTFLFIEGAGEWTYGMIPGRGVLYFIELVFVSFALTFLIKRQKIKGMKFIVLWIILSPVPAAISKGVGLSANRVVVMIPAIQVLSAFGAVCLVDSLGKKYKNPIFEKLAYFGVFLLISVSTVSFIEDYVYHAPIGGARSMHYGMREAVEYVGGVEGQFDEVLFSRSLSVPQIWVGFFNKVNPVDFQNASKDWLRYKQQGLVYVDQLSEYKLGKYTFSSIDVHRVRGNDRILLIGYPEEFLYGTQALKSVNYFNNDPAILIVDSSDL